jgi:hypothetical protein
MERLIVGRTQQQQQKKNRRERCYRAYAGSSRRAVTMMKTWNLGRMVRLAGWEPPETRWSWEQEKTLMLQVG